MHCSKNFKVRFSHKFSSNSIFNRSFNRRTSHGTIRRERGFTSCCGCNGRSAPSLRRSWRPRGRLKNCLVHGLLPGGVSAQGLVVEGIKGVKYTPMLPEIYENDQKRAVSRTFWLINCQKSNCLRSQALNKIYS